jgi:class 3 adenylate cyclase
MNTNPSKYRSAGSGIAQTSEKSFGSRVVAILFADAVGFSKLTETEVPRFVQHFLGATAQLSNRFGDSIIAKNTWGDGLYFVFSDVDLAGNFALQLADLVTKQNWEKKGLPWGLNLRIALHAGPVYEFDDPITSNHSYSGTHVSRAEPTPKAFGAAR